MSQCGKSNKVAPLRVSQLLPELLAMQQNYGGSCSEEEEYLDSDSGGEADGGYFREATHPVSSRTLKEHRGEMNTDDVVYNQTYPSKEIRSGGKNQSKVFSTPLRTPRKHASIMKHVTASGRVVGGTPRSSAKKKTPRYMKGQGPSSSMKTTPYRKCLNLEDAFKSSTKAALFSLSKPHPTPGTTGKELVDRELKPTIKPTSLDEMFANAMQITDRHKEQESVKEKDVTGLSTQAFASQKNHQNSHATPKTNVTSNSIIKGYRDNFVTPLKPTDISGVNKYETPCTQNRSLFRQQQTPLFTIKELGSEFKQQSVKKMETTSSSVRKNKENEIADNIIPQNKKSLFKDSSDVVAVLKEVHNVNTPCSIFKQEPSKKIVTDLCFDNYIKTPLNENKPHFFSSQDNHKSIDLRKNSFVIDSSSAVKETHHFASNKYLNDKGLPPPPAQQSFDMMRFEDKNRIPVNKNPIADNLVNGFNRPQLDSGFQQRRMDVNPPSSFQQHRSQSVDNGNVSRSVSSRSQIAGRQFKTLTIKGKEYITLGTLGHGGSSEVFKVMDPEDSSMYAVKCVNLAVEQSVAQSYVNEIKLLQKLQGSDRVITMYDYEYVEKKRMLYVVLEMGDVDLSKLMKDYRTRESRLPLPILVCYWTEMLTAVRHIHTNGIIHSDLKPANFLLVHGRLKLIDFGIASSLNADATSILKDFTTGTFNYISPEAVNAGSEGRDPIKISYKSDVWSLGCILYSMLYGRTPFSHVTHIIAKMRALSNPDQSIEYPRLQGVPPVLMQALRWCLTHDVKKRPCVQDLIELPYIGDSLGQVPRPVSNKKVPLSIMMKLKGALTDEELACVINVLEGK